MSSPFRSSPGSISSRRSTPSRQTPNTSNGVRRVNGIHRSYWDSINDSPSRQLLEEFGRMLVNDERTFRQSLDEQTAAQAKLHVAALDRALEYHRQVQQDADRARERAELDIERERRRREEEEKRALEKARRDLEEQKLAEQRRQLEEAKAREEQRKKQEALKREQDEAKQREETQKQQQDAEKARRNKEEADKKAREDAEAKEREQQKQNEKLRAAQQLSASGSQPNGTGTTAARPSPLSAQPTNAAPQASSNLPAGIVSTVDERQAKHAQYLDLHKRLKQMREHVLEETKKVPGLKNQLSDWRRAIHKCCGQLLKGSSEDAKLGNRRATQEIVQHLDAAAQVSEPSIDVTQYLVENQQPAGANKQGPACLVFLLNHFAKAIVGQFISESAVDTKTADAIGVLAMTVFARPNYLFNGQSLIDILWAKYHKYCPVLFGIDGSERTKEGRMRLGWQIDKDTNSFVREQEHYDRMTGLGAGFAALTLRDFSKSKNANPAPNRIYWQSLARILNTPQPQVTHFVLLKAMIENAVARILSLFGGAGLAALRQALILFPRDKGPQDEKGRKLPAVTAILALPMVLQRDLHLSL